MQLRAGELGAQLAKSILPAYVIHGDEPLLALEAADAVRAAARRAGYAEREVLEPERSYDWSEFTHATGSLSLFAAKKLVELRLPSGKPGNAGAAAIAAYCERPSAERFYEGQGDQRIAVQAPPTKLSGAVIEDSSVRLFGVNVEAHASASAVLFQR